MTPREWDCFQCGSHFATDAQGELATYTLTAGKCQGCLRLLAILLASSHQRSLMRVVLDPVPVLTYTAIAARLHQGRPETPRFDYAKAAANDRDDE